MRNECNYIYAHDLYSSLVGQLINVARTVQQPAKYSRGAILYYHHTPTSDSVLQYTIS